MARTILVGTGDGLHLLEGQPARRRLFEGRRVDALHQYRGQWTILLDGTDVLRGTVDGDWVAMTALPADVGRCLYVRRGEVLLGTAEAHLLRIVDQLPEAVESFDDAPGREQWFTPWGGPPAVRSMTEDREGALYVNVHVGGILRSRPLESRGWQPTIAIGDDVHQVLYHPPQRKLLASTGKGLASSIDRGNTWRLETAGLHGEYCRAVATGGSMLFVTASNGPHAGEGALYRRPLRDGAAFEPCDNGVPERFPQNIDTHCLDAAESQVAFGTQDGSVYLSEDEGASWRRSAEGLPGVRCLAIDRA
jgi:hypothetical protein